MPTPEELGAHLDDVLSQYPNVPRPIAERLIGLESGGNPNAISPKGAMGLTQLMPGTAREMGVVDPLDWKSNVAGGIGYLSKQIDRFGSVPLGLAAYQSGPGTVSRNLAQGGSGFANVSDGNMTPAQYAKRILGPDGGMMTDTGEPVALKDPRVPTARGAPNSDWESRLGAPVPINWAPEVKEKPSLFGVTKSLLWGGVDATAQDFRETVRAALGDDVVEGMDKLGSALGMPHVDDVAKMHEAQLPPEWRDAASKDWIDETAGDASTNLTDYIGPAWSDWRSYFANLVTSIPGNAMMMIPSMRLGSVAGQWATKKALAKGAADEVAQAAGDRAAANTAHIAGALIEGADQGGQSARQVYEEVKAMDPKLLATSEAFKALLASGLTPAEAQEQLARDLRTQVYIPSAVATGIFSGLGDRALTNIIRGRIRGRWRAAGLEAGSEGAEELFQNYLSTIAENVTKQQADATIPTTQGALNQAVGGAVGGAMLGGGMGAAFHQGKHQAEFVPPAPQSGPNSAPIPPQAPIAPTEAGSVPTATISPQETPNATISQPSSGAVGAYPDGNGIVGRPGESSGVGPSEQGAQPAAEGASQTEAVPAPAAQIAPEPPTSGMQPGDVGRAKDGQPFAAKRAADGRMGALELADTHDVVQIAPDQFVIRPKAEGAAVPEQAPDSHQLVPEQAPGGATPDLEARLRAERDGMPKVRQKAFGVGTYDAATNSLVSDDGTKALQWRPLDTKPEGVIQLEKREASAVQAASVGSESNTSGAEPTLNSGLTHAQVFGNGANAIALRVKGFDSLDRDRQQVVLTKMVRSLNDQQIFDGVVKSVPVDVMHGLADGEFSAENLLHGKSVLAHRLAVARDVPVPEPVARFVDAVSASIERRAAGGGAEKARLDSGANAVELPGKGTPAIETGAVDTRHIVEVGGQRDAVNITPTDAQKEAGNYKKAHTTIGGLDIAIENPEGSKRRPEWPTLKSHYGYIKGTVGKDKDHIDVFIKPGTPEDYSGPVFVVDQKNNAGLFDEHKILLGFASTAEARKAYLENYTKGWNGLGAMRDVPLDAFKRWLAEGDTKKPYAPQHGRASVVPPTRQPDTAGEAMRSEIGWAQHGGELVRQTSGFTSSDYAADGTLLQGAGAVIGRTKWIAKSDFWAGRPDKSLTEQAAHVALDKAGRGDALNAKEKRFAAYAARVANDRIAADNIAQAESDEERAALKAADLEPAEESIAQRAIDDALGREMTDAEVEEWLAGGTGEAAARPAGEGEERGAQGVEGAPLELTGQTNAEVVASEDKATADAEAKAAADKAAADKETADREAGSFNLSGSDRPADVLAAKGQGDLLAQAEAIKPAPANPAISEQPVSDEGASDSRGVATERFSDTLERHAPGTKRFGALDVETQRVMVSTMLNAIGELKVRAAIVRLVPVGVMNQFVGSKSAAEGFLHDPAVFANALSTESEAKLMVSVARIFDALREAPAAVRAEVLNRLRETGRGDRDGGAAPIAGHADLVDEARGVAGDGTEIGAPDGGSTSLAEKGGPAPQADDVDALIRRSGAASPGAEVPAGNDFGGNATKAIPTAGAGDDRHPSIIADFGSKIGGARKDVAKPLGPRGTISKTVDERPAWARPYIAMEQTVRSSSYSFPMRNGTPPARTGKWELMRANRGGSGQVSRVSRTAFDTEEQALAAIPLAELARNHRTYSYTDKAGDTKHGIFRLIGERKRALVKGGFATDEEAMKAMAADPVPIIEHKFDFPEKPWLDHIERVGPELRKGDVSTKQFQEDFGFRAGEFGNWNMGSDGQAALNHAYDALHDLAATLGIPPRALSLNGELAVAFGARGTGGVNAASAHYEPDRIVINLTKIKGAGSLAHEWFHALDDYLTRSVETDQAARSRRLLREGARPYATYGFGSSTTARPELVKAFKNLVDTMTAKKEGVAVDENVAERRLTRAQENVKHYLDDLRGQIAKGREYGKKKAAATAKQLSEWDALATRALAGDGGESVNVPPPAPGHGFGYQSSQVVRDLNAIYKAVTGRSFDRADRESTGRRVYWGINSVKDANARVAAAQEGTIEERRTGTEFLDEAKKIDGFRASDYWSTRHEMGARAFESYIFDKMTAAAAKSDYLVHGVENKYYAALDMKPYPEGAERTAIDAAFDALFKAIESKETDQGTALFSRSTEAPARGLSLGAVQTQVDSIAASVPYWPKQQVVQRVADLPTAAPEDARGMLYKGTLYYVADNLGSAFDVEHVAFHEVFHDAVRSDPLLQNEFDRIAAANPNVRKAAAAWRAANGRNGMSEFAYKLTSLEEALADMARRGEKINGLQRLLARIQEWLRKVGLNQVADWLERHTDAEALSFVGGAVAQHTGAAGEPAVAGDAAATSRKAPIWRSALAEAVAAKAPFAKDGSIDSIQLARWLDARTKDGAFKKDELEWSGLTEYLAMQKRVTRDDVGAFLDQNGVRVEETTLGGEVPDAAREAEIDRLARLFAEESGGWDEQSEQVRADLRAEAEASLATEEMGGEYTGIGTKYGNWQQPGGAGYRELLLTLPAKPQKTLSGVIDLAQKKYGKAYRDLTDDQRRAIDADSENEQRIAGPAPFRQGHFSDVADNVLAHVRLNERTDADGKRIVFIEELQSDWAQQGRKMGFNEPAKVVKNDVGWTLQLPDGGRAYFDTREAAEARSANLSAGRSIPPAPFVGKTEAWVALALKRMIRYAADNGFDAVAWTSGEQQAVRYDLARQIDSLSYNLLNHGQPDQRYAVLAQKGRNTLFDHDYTAAQLPEVVGKEIAEKIINDPKGRGELHGLDLKVGGEGMRGFYDKIVPTVANDVLKKLGGGKVTTFKGLVENGVQFQHYEGDTLTLADVNRLLIDRSIQSDMRYQLVAIKGAMEDGVPFRTAIQENGSSALAERVGGNMLQNERVGEQQGFEITPALRARALEGLPLFSRALPGLGPVTKESVQDQLAFMLNSSKTLNWWHKTIGTQFHIAETVPAFKPVFRAAQAYVNDTNEFSMDAAQLAPSILPTLKNLTDIVHRGPSRADFEATAKAVFEGTLNASKVYSDDELKAQGLTDKQIGMYRETRAAIDRSLDDLAVSTVARMVNKTPGAAPVIQLAKGDPDHAREHYDGLLQPIVDEAQQGYMRAVDKRRDALKAFDNATAKELKAAKGPGSRLTVTTARTAGRAELEERHDAAVKSWEYQRDHINQLIGDVHKTFDRAQQLQDEGYAPLMRFGQYLVNVADAETGESLFFGMYESQAEQRRMERRFQEEFPDGIISTNIISKEAWKLFGGISLDSLELFAQEIGQEENAVFQQYLRLAVNNRSALKRLMRRKGTPGFEQDVSRVLATFATSNARLAARNYHLGEMKEAANAIPRGDVKDQAAKLVDYVQNPQEEASALRGLLFVNYLGGNIASALVNMTQPIIQTLPYLSKYLGPAGSLTALTGAARAATGGPIKDPALKAALALAEKKGITEPVEVHALYAESIRTLGSSLPMRKFLRAWGSLFSLAESFNRKITFVAAFRAAEKMTPAELAKTGFASSFAFAEQAVHETQGVYNRANRPNWARGGLGATLFTFKQFSFSYVEFLKRLPPREKALAFAILIFAAGLQGVPFAEDLEDLIDTVGQGLGYNLNSKKALREFAATHLGEFGRFLTHGISGVSGMPVDIGRLGFGNMIPGTALLKRSEVDKTRDVNEAFGPAGGFVTGISHAFDAAVAGDAKGVAAAVAPTAVQNALKAVDMAQTGYYRDLKGRNVVPITTGDIVSKAIGLQPQVVAEASRKARDQQQDIGLARHVQAEIADQMAQGRVDGDPAKIEKARQDLLDWNAKNPGSRIRLDMNGVNRRIQEMRKLRDERITKSAPASMRPAVREGLQ